MRVVVVGGAGNFGARIVRALRGDPNIELMVAGRRFVSVPGADDIPGVLINIDGAGFAQAVKDLSPGLIIHCVGPFQRIARPNPHVRRRSASVVSAGLHQAMQRAGEYAAAHGMNEGSLDKLLADES
jgi:nucleoside-diphosphate-sugar epimerase